MARIICKSNPTNPIEVAVTEIAKLIYTSVPPERIHIVEFLQEPTKSITYVTPYGEITITRHQAINRAEEIRDEVARQLNELKKSGFLIKADGSHAIQT